MTRTVDCGWPVGAGAFAWPLLAVRETEDDVALIVERHQKIDTDLVAALQFEKKQEVYAYPQNYYSTGWGGGVSYGAGYALAQNQVEYRNNFAEVEAKQAKVIADAEKDRQQVWGLLQNETDAMRSQLSKKYNTPL